jgi:DNA-binding transcriptional ArsR family regulator
MKRRAAQLDRCRTALTDHLRPELFRALGDPNRLTLLARLALASGPMSVTEAADCCGVHLSGVSRHLAMLRDAGVLHATKQGREVRYELDCSALAGALRQMADAFDACHAACCAPTKGDRT